MKDLSNENVIHIVKDGVQYLQFRRLLEYSDILVHAYSLGIDKNFRTARAKTAEPITKEEFKDLQDYMYKVIKQISNEILSGKIDLKPFYKNKKTPCSYCDYRSICNFNNGACQNKYNFIDEKSKKEILEKIKQEKSN